MNVLYKNKINESFRLVLLMKVTYVITAVIHFCRFKLFGLYSIAYVQAY